jgi:hypothetical protein
MLNELVHHVTCRLYTYSMPVTVAARFKALVCGHSPADVVGLNSSGVCEWCTLLGSGVCDELITGPGESYRLWCVVLCDLETS